MTTSRSRTTSPPAEDVAELAVEIQAKLAEAMARCRPAHPKLAATPSAKSASWSSLVREASLIYWRDLRAYGPIAQLRSSTRRRKGCLALLVVRCRAEPSKMRRAACRCRRDGRRGPERTRHAATTRPDQHEYPEEVVVTNDKKQPGLPVVEVDQAFPADDDRWGVSLGRLDRHSG